MQNPKVAMFLYSLSVGFNKLKGKKEEEGVFKIALTMRVNAVIALG